MPARSSVKPGSGIKQNYHIAASQPKISHPLEKQRPRLATHVEIPPNRNNGYQRAKGFPCCRCESVYRKTGTHKWLEYLPQHRRSTGQRACLVPILVGDKPGASLMSQPLESENTAVSSYSSILRDLPPRPRVPPHPITGTPTPNVFSTVRCVGLLGFW
ncbi:hypothetical protein GGTG_08657 [Gaeumannomyces tritici R3-111a-1]|uniref:Uncharacterized protein n=1 Tax=Gaeumannomyces tritici (strain R3-111a-1) TaxID=644352 RepID=J3P568_GAET3|nr:hypothetical protein GGTG_08657 [Gaeumannomyces tritici R3-111a-1]EJT74819.1 hypothetical protein GGTG_08657 [Gaeumannomyces tritici R3-111a-1]